MTRLPPYAGMLGVVVERGAEGLRLRLSPGAHLRGRPGFLHGGAIAGLLEIAALAALAEALDGQDEAAARPRTKPINVSVDFMRGGREIDTFAAGRVLRIGSRIANLDSEAWQEDRAKPIAAARMTVMLAR